MLSCCSTSSASPRASSPTRSRCAPAAASAPGVALLVGLALAPVAAAGALATTDEGLGGSIDNAWTSLTDTSAVGPANDPSRLTATGSVRSRYWDEAFQMWGDEPVTGLGAGGYATARPRYRQDLLDVRHAHGYVPETMAELGLLGLGAQHRAARRVDPRRAHRDPRARASPERAGLVTLAATAVVLGAHASIDWTWAIPGTAVVGLVCAGFVAGRGPGAGAPSPARPSRTRWREPRRLVPARRPCVAARARRGVDGVAAAARERRRRRRDHRARQPRRRDGARAGRARARPSTR